MVKAVIDGVRYAGFMGCVPSTRHSYVESPDPFTREEAEKLAQATGVWERRVAPAHICASDLGTAAAEALLERLGWAPDSVEILVFVSQDADYNLPATACLIQRRLGLPTSAACFDVGLGCSGFVYGSWIAARLLAGSTARRALVLAGDINTRYLKPEDRATLPLFGDAAAAAALERDDGAPPMHAVFGTDGAGAPHIHIRAGGRRHPLVPGLAVRTPEEEEALAGDSRLHMNGTEVFAFTLRAVPALVRETLEFAGLTVDDVDICVMHQANAFMLEHLRKKVKIPPERFIVDLQRFGNTSSASIPLAIGSRLGEELARGPRRLLLAGFGVGWSWGALTAEVGPIPPPGVIELPDDFVPLTL